MSLHAHQGNPGFQSSCRHRAFFQTLAPDAGSEEEIYRPGDVHPELTLLLDKLDRFQSVQL